MLVALAKYDQGDKTDEKKKGYVIPKIEVTHFHQLRVIIYYDEVQSVVRTTRSLRERSLLGEAKKLD